MIFDIFSWALVCHISLKYFILVFFLFFKKLEPTPSRAKVCLGWEVISGNQRGLRCGTTLVFRSVRFDWHLYQLLPSERQSRDIWAESWMNGSRLREVMSLGRPQELREAGHMLHLGRMDPRPKLPVSQQSLEAVDPLNWNSGSEYLHGNQWEPKTGVLKILGPGWALG